MNFYQAPVTRYLNIPGTGPTATTFTDITVTPQAFSGTAPFLTVSSANTGFVGGPATNVFFETPNWPSSTYSINLEYDASASGAAPLLVAPNVVMTDADASYFIRGNSVLANTSNTIINVVYCATIMNVVPAVGTTRASASNSNWIQPGDRIDISGNGQLYTNQSSGEVATPGSTLTVQAARFKTNSTNYLVEFNAAIRTDGNASDGTSQGFTVSGTGAGAGVISAYELTLKTGASTYKGLAKDALTLKVTGRSASDNSIIWTGTLSFAINLSYTVNNSSSLFTAGTAPLGTFLNSYLDPSRFMQVSKAWAKYNMRPLAGNGTSMVSQRLYVDRDLVAGGEPYRCLALINPGSVAYQVAVTINPIS